MARNESVRYCIGVGVALMSIVAVVALAGAPPAHTNERPTFPSTSSRSRSAVPTTRSGSSRPSATGWSPTGRSWGSR